MILRKGCSWSSFCYAAMFGHSHLWNPKRPAHRAASGMTPPHPLGDRQQQTNWLVVGPPLWKIWLRQLRDDDINPIFLGKSKMATKPPTSWLPKLPLLVVHNPFVGEWSSNVFGFHWKYWNPEMALMFPTKSHYPQISPHETYGNCDLVTRDKNISVG